MNPEIKALWAAWLRENADKQGTGTLRRIGAAEDGSEDRYCCLGGLCELAVQAGIVVRQQGDHSFLYEYSDPQRPGDLSRSALPKVVQEWAGLNYKDPWVRVEGNTTTLINVNDGIQLPFAAIANIIEVQL